MAKDDNVAELRKGVDVWNARRKGNPFIRPDLSGADLSGAFLITAMLVDADPTGADLTGCYVYGVSAWV
jgi:uncharacterized protein YjbI with pentapeptide repeats